MCLLIAPMVPTLMENSSSAKQANSRRDSQVSIFCSQMGRPITGIGADVKGSGLQMVQDFKLFPITVKVSFCNSCKLCAT